MKDFPIIISLIFLTIFCIMQSLSAIETNSQVKELRNQVNSQQNLLDSQSKEFDALNKETAAQSDLLLTIAKKMEGNGT